MAMTMAINGNDNSNDNSNNNNSKDNFLLIFKTPLTFLKQYTSFWYNALV